MAAKNGNAMTYDAQHKHAVSGYGSNTYSYDANGNQTSRMVNDGESILNYDLTYDAENHLVQVDLVGDGMKAPVAKKPVARCEPRK